jgi:nuclear GTP-binding protein
MHFVHLASTYRLSTTLCPWRIPPHGDATMVSEPTLSSLAQLAASASANDLVPTPSESAPAATKTKEQLRRHHVRMLHKFVDESGVVILILDARDPAGCRSRWVEEEVRRREVEGKRLLFVLNKMGTCASS